jgi:hypothetical protein
MQPLNEIITSIQKEDRPPYSITEFVAVSGLVGGGEFHRELVSFVSGVVARCVAGQVPEKDTPS